MHARLFKFIFCSLVLHLMALWLFLQPLFEHGPAQGKKSAHQTLAVTIVADAPVAPPAALQAQQTAAPPAEETPSLSAESTETSPRPEIPEADAGVDYLSGGQLTRLPAPLEHIDLNRPEISELAFAGKATLTILIDADGTVADVIADTGSAQEREFADMVAGVFRKTRFTPGQIDGKPVRSTLQVTIVSEPETPTEEQ